jgi:hypothetical protein
MRACRCVCVCVYVCGVRACAHALARACVCSRRCTCMCVGGRVIMWGSHLVAPLIVGTMHKLMLDVGGDTDYTVPDAYGWVWPWRANARQRVRDREAPCGGARQHALARVGAQVFFGPCSIMSAGLYALRLL